MPVSPDPDLGSGVRTRAQIRLAATVAQASAQRDIGESQEGAGATSTVNESPKKRRTRKKSSTKRKSAAKNAQANASVTQEPPAQASQSTVTTSTDNATQETSSTTIDTNLLFENLKAAAAKNTNRDGTPVPKVKTDLRLSQEFFETMHDSTPLRVNTHNMKGLTKEQQEKLIEELETIPNVERSYLKGLYVGLATEDEIEKFLKDNSLYDFKKNTWTVIPEEVTKEDDLYAPFEKIITAIIKVLAKVPEEVRKVIDTHSIGFVHHDDANPTRPDISIRATGPSFQEPREVTKSQKDRIPGQNIGYSNVAAVFDIKRDADKSAALAQAAQLAIYNRQIFIHQPNRLFCRSLIITEKHVRLLHYDRSGAYKTGYIDIHEDPYTFVRLILGLTSTDEAILGLDTNIQWVIEDGVKVSGTITIIETKNLEKVTFDLIMEEPPTIREVIRGRGTICWHAKDKDGNRVVIKDSWRADGRTNEYLALAQAKGRDGVAQARCYQDYIAETRQFRPKHFRHEDFFNRTLSRIAMDCYGRSLVHFKSRYQAIAALRDVVAGHRNLLLARVLHRDISPDNILLGKDNARVGMRGILIDLDMSVRAEGEREDVSPEGRSGTPEFQSVNVLEGYANADADGSLEFYVPWPQDYLDDLEAILWVLLRLLYGFKGVGLPTLPKDPGFRMFGTWKEMEPAWIVSKKTEFLGRGGERMLKRLASHDTFWGQVCIDLCNNIRECLQPLANSKLDYRSIMTDVGNRREAFSLLYDGINTHYTEIIGFFDAALAELKPSAVDDSPPRPYANPVLALPPIPAQRGARFHPPGPLSAELRKIPNKKAAAIREASVLSSPSPLAGKRILELSEDDSDEDNEPVPKRSRNDIRVGYHTLFQIADETSVTALQTAEKDAPIFP